MISPRSIAAALHGESPHAGAIVLAYLTGVGGAGLALWLQVHASGPGVDLLAAGVLAFVALDLFAGAVANLSSSTRQFYRARPRFVRVLFLAGHAAQPGLVAAFVAPPAWPYLAASFLTAFGGGTAIQYLRPAPLREAVAGAVFAAGTAVCLALCGPSWELAWFAPVYLGKLVLGFSLGTAGERDHAENR